jgi:hypothetical protein
MTLFRPMRLLLRFVSLFALSLCTAAFAAKVTSPKEHFGFAIGDDYHLATYTQTEAYFKKIAGESDRVRLVDMGKTEEGRTQWMVVISSPENIKSLARYKDIAQKLARAEGLTNAQARTLAAEGKAIVWIDGGLHATETVGSHQLIETVWTLASATDPEITRVLKDVIVLCAHANPDGQELVASWYMRESDPQKRSMNGLRGSTKNTSATTTTATSTWPRKRRARTSTASSTSSGSRRLSTTTTSPGRPAPSSSRRPSAIRSITSTIRSS